MSISPEFDRAWALYEELRRKGQRREAVAFLDKAIEELEKCPEELRRAWCERFIVPRAAIMSATPSSKECSFQFWLRVCCRPDLATPDG